MNTNEAPAIPLLTVTSTGSIILPGGRLAKPGDRLNASLFVGHEDLLRRLLSEGRLTTRDIEVDPIDWARAGSEQLPAAPGELDEKTQLTSRPGSREAQLRKMMEDLKKEREALTRAADAGQELTVEQARSMGLIK